DLMSKTDVPPRSKARHEELEIDPRFQGRERQPGLDLLRALAIVVVVIYHAALFGFKLPGRVDRFGWIGVDLFFVLSGYLICGQFLAPPAPPRAISLWGVFAPRRPRQPPPSLCRSSPPAAPYESSRPISSSSPFMPFCRRGGSTQKCRRFGN